MFKKLVSNLPFSPALIGQIGFYANRLRQEEVSRRTGLVLTALAVAMQTLILVSPPTPANAQNQSDTISGGLATKQDLLTAYTNNSHGIKDILSYAGITKNEVQSINESAIPARSPGEWSLWNRVPKFSDSQGEFMHNIKGFELYSRPISLYTATTDYPVFIGRSASAGDFAIVRTNGNLMLSQSASSTLAEKNSATNNSELQLSKISANLTQGIKDATTTKAMAGDRIQYTINIKNSSPMQQSVTMRDHLGDVLEYASIQDSGGGVFDIGSQSLIWSGIELQPGAQESRSFVIAMPASIPSTPRGASDPTSYDCTMSNAYGNSVQIAVDCQTPKLIEQTVEGLPYVGSIGNIIFSVSLLAITLFFWARSKQLSKEIRLVRREFSSGAIL